MRKLLPMLLLMVSCQLGPAANPPAEPKPDLQELTKRAIDTAHSKVSPARREVLSHLLPYVANQVFQEHKHKEYWIALIGVESAFDSSAVSPQGAVGLGQLLPKFRDDFAAACNLPQTAEVDVRDDFTNAWLSACVLRQLIDKHGSVPLALVAYNAGPNSSSMKAAKKGGAPTNKETADYVSKVMIRRDLAKEP